MVVRDTSTVIVVVHVDAAGGCDDDYGNGSENLADFLVDGDAASSAR